MVKAVLGIYDYFRRRRWLCACLLACIAGLLVVSGLSLGYKEDISDFMPMDDRDRRGMEIYQGISGGNRILVLFEAADTSAGVDRYALMEAVDAFSGRFSQMNPTVGLMSQIDASQMEGLMDWCYSNIPYLMTDSDFSRLDSLLDDGEVYRRLERDKELLMFPTGSMLSQHIQVDPLNVFTPVVARLRDFGGTAGMDVSDGYIFTPDGSIAVAVVTSPYGANETGGNKVLLDSIYNVAEYVAGEVGGVSIRAFGAPSVAVTNASRIKADSIISVAVAVVLIMLLLVYSFRRRGYLMFIFLTLVFGMVFAMGVMGMLRDSISLIVLGMASIIVGIAANYPLHFIAHLEDAGSVRDVLKELAKPLIIGNVTTVGAFLCLLPLDSRALQDLGLFAGSMLVGSIFFVVVFLPHMVRPGRVGTGKGRRLPFRRMSNFAIEGHRRIVAVLAVVTVVLGYFSLSTGFDTDIHNINYMTEAEAADMTRLQSYVKGDSSASTIYVITEGRDADEVYSKAITGMELRSRMDSAEIMARVVSPADFLPGPEEQVRRIARWDAFWKGRGAGLADSLERDAVSLGFSASAFGAFKEIIGKGYKVEGPEYFSPLASTALAGYSVSDSSFVALVSAVSVAPSDVARARDAIGEGDGHYTFDVNTFTSGMAESLSGEFNYIAFSCGIIVFVFLWLSFGRIELSLIAFLPMAVSWIWILGLMDLSGLKFNIVNIILATFIFGQGDDYTIFITEGLVYEYTYGKRLLASFKSSIIISALIMFTGIGALAISDHPALFSLAAVTVVGMFSVVLMAYLLPPLAFGFLVGREGNRRDVPLTLWGMLRRPRRPDAFTDAASCVWWIRTRYIYKGLDVERRCRRVLSAVGRCSSVVDSCPHKGKVLVVNSGQGEVALMLALTRPGIEVSAVERDDDLRSISMNLACNPVNLLIYPEIPGNADHFDAVYIINPEESQRTACPWAAFIEV